MWWIGGFMVNGSSWGMENSNLSVQGNFGNMSNSTRSSDDKVRNVDSNLRENPPFLSIIVLSWNRLELLRTTVLSFLANTYCPFEMFIVDNNSARSCTDWIKFISKDHSSIHPILTRYSKPNFWEYFSIRCTLVCKPFGLLPFFFVRNWKDENCRS